ncbi:MAG: TonB-dependent receptor, partial [Rikenellaceae bacterium]
MLNGKSCQPSNDKFLSPMHTSFDNTKYDAKGRYTAGTDDTFFYDGDMTVSYGELINDVHQLNAVIGARFREDQYITEANTSIGYPIGNFSRPSFAIGYGTGKPSYRTSAVRSASFYFNGGYSYKNRYLLDANFRLDGTSVFGSNKRFTETWAVGLAWNIHNEPFLKDVKWISRLKVRASMGNPGNQNFDAFQSYTTYSFNNWIQNPFGGSMTVTGFGNADLEWQKTIDKNIGADISFLDNRLNINFDVYNKKTDPLLAEVNVPSSVGNKVVLTNMGT